MAEQRVFQVRVVSASVFTPEILLVGSNFEAGTDWFQELAAGNEYSREILAKALITRQEQQKS